jgi:hypothetical protein
LRIKGREAAVRRGGQVIDRAAQYNRSGGIVRDLRTVRGQPGGRPVETGGSGKAEVSQSFQILRGK